MHTCYGAMTSGSIPLVLQFGVFLWSVAMRREPLSHCFSLSAEIAKCMGQSLHFNTYGGNPLACAVGSAVLDVSCRASILELSFAVTYEVHEL